MSMPTCARFARLDTVVTAPAQKAELGAGRYGCALASPKSARRIDPCSPQHRKNVDMTTLELKLNLPDSLAKEAKRLGLLDSDSLQSLLREAVRDRRITQLAEARKKIAAAGIAPMTMEEIQAEIDADRAERRAKTGG